MSEVLAALSREARPLPARRLPLEEAVGGILSEPLAVAAPVPAEARALRPGYAVGASDLVGASSYAPLLLADSPPWVEAGGALPPGTDSVLPPDATSRQGSLVEVVAGVSPGEGVCRRGDDAPAGAILREAGDELRARDVAVARAAGLEHALVRRPRIAVVSETSARTDWRAALALAGLQGDVVQAPSRDAPDRSAAASDVLILATHDPAEASRMLDASDRIVARGLALRPGETTRVAMLGAAPLVILPPRLDGLLAVGRCLLGPFLRHVTRARPDAIRRCGPLRRKLSSGIGFTELALLREAEQGVEPLAIGALSLPALAGAQYWLAIPPESEGHQPGDMIDAFDL